MKRARIKAVANVSVGRKVSKIIPKASTDKKDEEGQTVNKVEDAQIVQKVDNEQSIKAVENEQIENEQIIRNVNNEPIEQIINNTNEELVVKKVNNELTAKNMKNEPHVKKVENDQTVKEKDFVSSEVPKLQNEVNIKTSGTNIRLISNIKVELPCSTMLSRIGIDNEVEPEVQHALKRNIKLEREDIFHESSPVIVYKGSCQNESILPTPENNETVSCSMPDVTTSASVIRLSENENIKSQDINRVTINDVIRNKLYARAMVTPNCSECGEEDCDGNHNKTRNHMEESITKPVQVKVGFDGQIIIDYSASEETNTDNASPSYVDPFSRFGECFKKRRIVKDWNTMDTAKFFEALNFFGTDFTLMQSWFPNRTRNDLKSKFKKEERLNRLRVDRALMNQNFHGETIQKEIEICSKKPTVKSTEPKNKKSKKRLTTKADKSSKNRKKRKRSFTAKSIEMSSEEEESEEEDEMDVETIELDEDEPNNAQVPIASQLNDIRYEEMNIILKEMRSKQQEIGKLNERLQRIQKDISVAKVDPSYDLGTM